MGLNDFKNKQKNENTKIKNNPDEHKGLDSINKVFEGEQDSNKDVPGLSKLAEQQRRSNVFKDASNPSDNFAKKKKKKAFSKSQKQIDDNKLSLFAYKVLKPGTEIVDNFTDNEPVINPLINYYDSDNDNLDILKQQLNWNIFGDFRHVAQSGLNGGARLSFVMPKYLINAMNTVVDSINKAEDNNTVKQIIEDLDVTDNNGNLVNPGKNMSTSDYKIYHQSIRINQPWLIISLLLGTIKIDDELRSEIITNICTEYKGKEYEMQYLLMNNIITPNNFKDVTNKTKIIISPYIVKWYNLSLFDTAKRIFTQDLSKENVLKSFDENKNLNKFSDGAVSNMLLKLGSDRTMINNRLHYVLFVE